MICGWLSIGRFADRFECGQIALVMRQQGAEYAVADIFRVAYISLCSYLLTSLDKPVSKAAHAVCCYCAAVRSCSNPGSGWRFDGVLPYPKRNVGKSVCHIHQQKYNQKKKAGKGTIEKYLVASNKATCPAHTFGSCTHAYMCTHARTHADTWHCIQVAVQRLTSFG